MLMKTGMGKIHVRIYFNIIKYIIREEGGFMNRKFFIMALIKGVFGYFPCGLGLHFPYRRFGALLHKAL